MIICTIFQNIDVIIEEIKLLVSCCYVSQRFLQRELCMSLHKSENKYINVGF